jgi:aminopeptidase N
MPLRRTGVLVGLSVALCASLLAGSASATYDGGLSTPQEDSYYPAHGDPGIDVLHYGLDLDWHRGSRTLRGVADINLRATGDAGSFQLDLGRTLRVQRVTVDGEPVDSTHGNEVLTVLAPVVADERYDVRVVYRGTPERVRPPTTRSDAHDHGGMAVTANGQLRTMQEPFGAFTWYPVNDQPSDKALYDVRVEAPRHWVGVSNGMLVGRHRTDGRTVTRFHLEHPAASYLVTLAVGPYELHRDTGPHGLPLSFWLSADAATRPGGPALAGVEAGSLPVRERGRRHRSRWLGDGDPDPGDVRRQGLGQREVRP